MKPQDIGLESFTQIFGPGLGIVVAVFCSMLLLATILMPFMIWSIRRQVRALRRMAAARDEQQTLESRTLVDKLNVLIVQAHAVVDELKPIREALSDAKVERVPE